MQARHLDAGDAHACFLADQLQFHWPARRMRWVDWSRDDTFPLMYRAIPGTIMATLDDRFAYPEDGPQARQSEDLGYLTARGSGAGHDAVRRRAPLRVFVPRSKHLPGGAPQRTQRRFAAFLRDRLATAHVSAVYYPLPRPFTFIGPGGETLFVVHSEVEASVRSGGGS